MEESLARCRVPATLTRGTVEALPYQTGFFDCAVTISALEYVPDIEAACREIQRVLKPDGVLAVVTPGATPLWDLALRLPPEKAPASTPIAGRNSNPPCAARSPSPARSASPASARPRSASTPDSC